MSISLQRSNRKTVLESFESGNFDLSPDNEIPNCRGDWTGVRKPLDLRECYNKSFKLAEKERKKATSDDEGRESKCGANGDKH